MTAAIPPGYFINYRLKKKYELILRDIEPDRILGYLYQEEVIDEDDMEEVRAEKTRKMKGEKLIKILQGKIRIDARYDAMEMFVEVLEQKQPHLARILNTEIDGECYAWERKIKMNPPGPIERVTSEMSEMNISGHQTCTSPKEKSGAVENDVVSLHSHGPTTTETRQHRSRLIQINMDRLPPYIDQDHEDVYTMKRKPRGLMVIINNINFSPDKERASLTLDRREGSEVDVQKLEDLFQELYFTVVVHEDLTGQQLKDKVLSYSQGDYSEHDAFVLCLMSHGQEDGILGTDGMDVEITSLRDMFTSSNCPTLAGKPKFIIVQACRLKIDRGRHEVKDGPYNSQQPEDEKNQYWELQFPGKKTIADAADFILAYACVSGYASYRNVKSGSRFIQALCDVLYECSSYEHLLDMLTKVNDIVNKMGDKHHKQIPQPLTTLTKKCYFWPYYYTASSPTTNASV